MKQILQKIKEAIKKHEELIKYLIIGVLTTVINYIIFAILVKLANIEMHVSNIIAWIVSVIFAYFTNKLFVFESKSFKLKVIGKEVLSFGAARIFSLGLEEVIFGTKITSSESVKGENMDSAKKGAYIQYGNVWMRQRLESAF